MQTNQQEIKNLSIIALRSYISLLKDPDNWTMWSTPTSKIPLHIWKNTNYRTPMQIAQSMENVLNKLEKENWHIFF